MKNDKPSMSDTCKVRPGRMSGNRELNLHSYKPPSEIRPGLTRNRESSKGCKFECVSFMANLKFSCKTGFRFVCVSQAFYIKCQNLANTMLRLLTN